MMMKIISIATAFHTATGRFFDKTMINIGDQKYSVFIGAFAKVEGDLSEIQWFHTDRGGEFINQTMDELLEAFNINRSLSIIGCPYDNAVAEATYKLMKTEFV